MRYVLYVIEEWVGDEDPNQWELMVRYDENGPGSALTFDSEQAAQEVVEELIEETGCQDDSWRVVKLTGESPR